MTVIDAPVRPASKGENLPTISPPRLPYHPQIEERFGVDRASWKALVEAIFPTATSTESVILALSYCRARKLDPFKRNVHIVPIWNKQLGRMVDTIWPGIGELRTTAFRTGEYAGRDKAEFGPTISKRIGQGEVNFPEWCQVTVYRSVKGERVAFAGPQVYWEETYATVSRNDDSPNEMWATRTRGQIEKCAEAAALRAAFPEEVGSDYIPEELGHDRTRAVQSVTVSAPGSKTEALLAKVTNRPVSEGQTLEPTPEALAEAEAEQSAEDVIANAPRAPQAEPDVSGVEAEPPAEDLSGLTTYEAFYNAMQEWAAAVKHPDFNALIKGVKLNFGKIERNTAAGTEERKRVYVAAFAGKLGPDGKITD